MKNFIKSKVGQCFLYTLLCVFVFTATHLLLGWLLHDYAWLVGNRLVILLFIILNLYLDIIAIVYIHTEIYLR